MNLFRLPQGAGSQRREPDRERRRGDRDDDPPRRVAAAVGRGHGDPGEGECEQREERPERAVWEGRGPARARAHTSYLLEPDGNGGTRFEYANEFKPPLGPVGAAANRVLMGGMPQREANRTLRRLKELVEAE